VAETASRQSDLRMAGVMRLMVRLMQSRSFARHRNVSRIHRHLFIDHYSSFESGFSKETA